MKSARRPIDSKLKDAILEKMRDRFPDAIITDHQFLSEPERRNIIIRLWIKGDGNSDTPSSMILKQSLPSTQLGVNSDEFARFSRDWAGLEFVSRVADEHHLVPRFYGGDKDQRFILLEDLGDKHVSLIDSLLASNRVQAENALERFMQALAKLHTLTYEQSSAFTDITEPLTGPEGDSKKDIENETDYFLKNIDPAIEDIDIPVPIDKHEIKEVLTSVYDSNGPFSVLTHGDVAPDNMFDHGQNGELQLIDFEACKYRSALLDATHLRMSMPTAWCAKSVPEDLLNKLEAQYRETLKEHVPAANDDRLYQKAYTDACAYHALHAMALIGKCLNENPAWGSGPVQKGLSWDPDENRLRPRVLSRLNAFVKVAEINDFYPHLRQTATNILEKLKVKWPNDKPLEFYPAFREAPQQKQQTEVVLKK